MSVPNLFEILTGDAGVSAIVGTNVFNTTAKENTTAPYIVWFVVSSVPQTSLDGNTSIGHYRLQIDMFTKSPEDKYALGDAVQAALVDQGYSLGIAVDAYEDATDLYRLSLDVSIWS